MRRWLVKVLAGVGLVAAVAACSAAPTVSKPAELKLDFAYYNVSSLVMHKFGWLEEDLKKDGVNVKWVYSAGSNKAIEFLQSDAVDFGSTAGAAAFLARANETPIKTVYIYSKPEWTALVVGPDSAIKSVAELKGKKVAATKGTDPWFFLLRQLRQNGLTKTDIEQVNLQHADGKIALERGQVDAWSGLDPMMAQSELETKSRLIVRNPDFNTYGFLNAREDFVNKYPDYVTRTLKVYEKARTWILEHPDDAAKILAEESKVSFDVAKKQLTERTDLKSGIVPGEKHAEMLKAVLEISKAEDLLKSGVDGEKAIKDLLDSRFASQIK